MGTPIASRYSTSSAISSSPPSSLAGSSSRKSNRLSVQPGDDPFAAHMRGAGDFAPALGGEEWRISEESTFAAEEREEVGNGQPAADGAVQVDKQQGIRGGKKVERRPSFLRGLLKRSSSRSSVLSSSVSTTSISAPVLNAENPPRLGPVRSSASLVSLVTASAQYDSRRNSYASGSTSLRGPSEQQRRNGARTPIYETFGGSLRGGEQGGRPLSRASSLNALSSEARRERRERERPEDMAKEQPHPPTESSKAFKMLGGSNITTSNRKGVERLTGKSALLASEAERARRAHLDFSFRPAQASETRRLASLLPPTPPPAILCPTTLAFPSSPPRPRPRAIVRRSTRPPAATLVTDSESCRASRAYLACMMWWRRTRAPSGTIRRRRMARLRLCIGRGLPPSRVESRRSSHPSLPDQRPARGATAPRTALRLAGRRRREPNLGLACVRNSNIPSSPTHREALIVPRILAPDSTRNPLPSPSPRRFPLPSAPHPHAPLSPSWPPAQTHSSRRSPRHISSLASRRTLLHGRWRITRTPTRRGRITH